MSKQDNDKLLQLVKNSIIKYPDFPKPGIYFRALHDLMLDHIRTVKPQIQVIVGLESRGFLFGPSLALHLEVPFVPIRKKGKLPGHVNQVSYDLEYGSDAFEIQTESIEKEQNVMIIDDVLATGGTIAAASRLVNQLGAQVIECLVVIEKLALQGREKIPAPVHSLIQC